MAFRSSSSTTYASRSSNTITAPAGIVNGDILVLYYITFGNPGSSAPVATPPAGFSVVPGPTFPSQADSVAAGGVKSWVWYKVAASESGNYTVTHTAASCQAILSCYSGRLTSAPFDANATQNKGFGTVTTFTGLTTVTPGTDLVLMAHDWGSTTNNLTPPAGFTERFDSLLSYSADQVNVVPAGATGNKTYTNNCANNNDAWNAFVIALAPATPTVVPKTPIFVCGAECGIAGAATASAGVEHWAATAGSVATVTSGPATMRSTRCFRLNQAGGGQSTLSHNFATAIGSPATMVGRFYLYFATLPTVDTVIVSTSLGSTVGLHWQSSDSTLRARAVNAVASGGKVMTTGVWYRIDFKFVAGTTQTSDLSVDGVAQTQASGSSSASALSGIILGPSLGSPIFDIYIDDICMSGTSGDFPIGAGTVVGLYPNGDGTHGGTWASGVFGKSTSGATAAARTDTDIWQSLSKPLFASAGTIWVSDLTGVVSTDYVEIVFDDMPIDASSVVNGLMAVVGSHSASATASTFGFTLVSGAGSTVLWNAVDLSEATVTVPIVVLNTDPNVSSAWTPTALNAVKGRFWSTDSNPDVYLDGVCYEVDYVQLPSGLPPKRLDIRQALQRGSFY